MKQETKIQIIGFILAFAVWITLIIISYLRTAGLTLIGALHDVPTYNVLYNLFHKKIPIGCVASENNYFLAFLYGFLFNWILYKHLIAESEKEKKKHKKQYEPFTYWRLK